MKLDKALRRNVVASVQAKRIYKEHVITHLSTKIFLGLFIMHDNSRVSSGSLWWHCLIERDNRNYAYRGTDSNSDINTDSNSNSIADTNTEAHYGSSTDNGSREGDSDCNG
jgi:hypothetical protein